MLLSTGLSRTLATSRVCCSLWRSSLDVRFPDTSRHREALVKANDWPDGGVFQEDPYKAETVTFATMKAKTPGWHQIMLRAIGGESTPNLL